MKSVKLLILGLSVLLTLSLVLTGCGNSGENVGIGEIVGQITYDNGDVQGTKVLLLDESVENVSSYEEFSVVEETTVDNNEGTYLFDGLFSGTYFVVAYKDENGSGELEFDEVNESPLEPANVYGVDGNPESFKVEDSTVTGIDIDISYAEGDYPQYTVEVEVRSNEVNELENASVVLYGKSGEEIQTGTTNASGLLSFDFIFDGEYYLEVTAGAGDDIHRGAILPYYRLWDIDTNEDMSVSFAVPMFTNDFITTLYGSGADEGELLLGILGTDPVAEKPVILDPSVDEKDIAYTLEESAGEITFIFGSGEFPSSFTSEAGYLLGIKNLSSSIDEYTLSISISGGEEVIAFSVKENRLIIALDQSDDSTFF